MFYMYILKSKKDNNLYIGSTNDLKKRFTQHNKGEVFATKSRIPFTLI
ncbi:MAG: GIY-YIG nuclease family protein [Candidatus Pacebacteria bacterium]|nr:GIY-YIG nuclease family protein [Candidatus Paceibacterota bacterium]